MPSNDKNDDIEDTNDGGNDDVVHNIHNEWTLY